MLRAGFRVLAISQEGSESAKLVASIATHLVNLYYRRKNSVDPLLVQCVCGLMNIYSNFHLPGSEDVFPMEEIDATLLVGVLLSIPPWSSPIHYNDQYEAQSELIGSIYRHYVCVAKNQPRFFSLLSTAPQFHSSLYLSTDLPRLSSTTISLLPYPCTRANPVNSLFQWLIHHTTALCKSIHDISLLTTGFVLKVSVTSMIPTQ